MGRDQAAKTAIAILGVIMKMSDEAEALGGATSIAGVASLHKMQRSIQNNGKRLAEIAASLLIDEGATS